MTPKLPLMMLPINLVETTHRNKNKNWVGNLQLIHKLSAKGNLLSLSAAFTQLLLKLIALFWAFFKEKKKPTPQSKINKNVCQRETANCNQSSLLIIGCLSENRVQHANVIANDNMNTGYDKHKVEHFQAHRELWQCQGLFQVRSSAADLVLCWGWFKG